MARGLGPTSVALWLSTLCIMRGAPAGETEMFHLGIPYVTDANAYARTSHT